MSLSFFWMEPRTSLRRRASLGRRNALGTCSLGGGLQGNGVDGVGVGVGDSLDVVGVGLGGDGDEIVTDDDELLADL